jgi:hypothetical protein
VKFTKPLATAATIAAAGSIGLFVGAPVALADPTTQNLGSQGELVDAAGNIVQGWTVSDLKVSSDTIPHPVNGTLWEATATDQAIQGGVTPIVSNFNARARDGETYRVLFGAATTQGVNPATLAQGEKTSGKIYFDVTGASPDSVVYNAGGQDLLVWVQAPASSGSGSSSGSSTRWSPGYSSGSGSNTSSSATPSTPATASPAPAQPAAVEGAPGTQATEGSQGTPLPAGSQGTPLPEGTTATPAGSQGTPLPEGTQGQPMPAGTGAAAPTSPAAAPSTTVAPAPPR